MLPVSRIKIDRAFVTDLPDNGQDAALCRSIINMGHNLECEVIAEGVETEAQATWLTGAVAPGFLMMCVTYSRTGQLLRQMVK